MAILLCSDGVFEWWPWLDHDGITSASREHVRRLLAGTALERAIAHAELSPEQVVQLMGPGHRHNSRARRAHTMRRAIRKLRELDLLDFVAAQAPLVDERTLAWWTQGIPAGAPRDEARAHVLARYVGGRSRPAYT